jgi:UPF0716 family protein affecting phage T7 exclusion
MFQSLKKHWHEFLRVPAGRRFQEVHKRRQHARQQGQSGKRTLLLGLGIALTVGGLALMLLPGPGTVVLAVGLGLLASESISLARVLDAFDKRLQKFLQYARRKWGQWSTARRVAFVSVVVLLLASAATGLWLYFFG